jgi:hypothetical protein
MEFLETSIQRDECYEREVTMDVPPFQNASNAAAEKDDDDDDEEEKWANRRIQSKKMFAKYRVVYDEKKEIEMNGIMKNAKALNAEYRELWQVMKKKAEETCEKTAILKDRVREEEMRLERRRTQLQILQDREIAKTIELYAKEEKKIKDMIHKYKENIKTLEKAQTAFSSLSDIDEKLIL